jgi:hypothetical protein
LEESESVKLGARYNQCSVCRHTEKEKIELLRSSGVPVRTLAERFGLKKDAVNRHFHLHITERRRAELLVGQTRLAELAEAAASESKTLLEYLQITRGIVFRSFG